MMQAFGGEVDARSARATADHARHDELGLVGQRGSEAWAVSLRESRDAHRLFVLLQAGLFLLDHLLRGSDQGLHLAWLSRGCPEVVCVVTVTRIASRATAVGGTHHTVFIPLTPPCGKSSMVSFENSEISDQEFVNK